MQKKIMTKIERCIRKNNGKRQRLNRFKTSQQLKRIFKMYIKTKLSFQQNI